MSQRKKSGAPDRAVGARGAELQWPKEPTPLNREQVISLISKHAKQLAALAREQGCTTLCSLLQAAVEQAEKELAAAPLDKDESDVS